MRLFSEAEKGIFAERYNSFVGSIKNHRCFAATVLLVPANYGFNKTMFFCYLQRTKKTRMNARVGMAVLGGVFLKGREKINGLKRSDYAQLTTATLDSTARKVFASHRIV
jgi:hypothetical protein